MPEQDKPSKPVTVASNPAVTVESIAPEVKAKPTPAPAKPQKVAPPPTPAAVVKPTPPTPVVTEVKPAEPVAKKVEEPVKPPVQQIVEHNEALEAERRRRWLLGYGKGV